LSNRGGKKSDGANTRAGQHPNARNPGSPGDAELPDVPIENGPGIPRWRQIEIMQERAQLRRMLDDLDMSFDELEAEIFGSEEDHDVFYRHFDESDEEEIQLDDDGEDDDFEEEDYEDLED
jgi:hypothetical protein